MDFFSAQEQSRRTTRLLVVLFGLAVIAIIVAVTAVGSALMGGFQFYGQNSQAIKQFEVDWVTLALIALSTGLFIGLASLYRTARLRQGGGAVARSLGGTEIAADTTDPLRQRLINVVEEMSIAAGVPVPEVFVLERESGINAFAAGFSPNDAAIAVTQGTLEQLNRDELQGVIGHEFSHILNGDMRINMRLIGALYGILVLSLVGRLLLRSGRVATMGSRRGNGTPLLVFGVALAVIGSVGVFFGRLIKAGVSRQREFLADASAVQFTRDPNGLAGALKKIGGFSSTLEATDSEEVAHMLFGQGSLSFRGWFATHPPVEQRIKLLDPQFAHEGRASQTHQGSDSSDPNIAGIAAGMVGRAGEPTPAELNHASALHDSMPAQLIEAAHAREGSFLLIIALALQADAEDQTAQLALLRNRLGEQRASYCARLSQSLREAGVAVRLPLLEMAFPRVKDRPASQLDFLLMLINELAALDNHLEPFELALVRTLESYLHEQPGFTPPKTAVASKRQIHKASVDLIATLAAYSHDDPDQTQAALRRGLATLAPKLDQNVQPERDLQVLDAALTTLATAPLAARRHVLIAAYASITADDHINLTEGELFRAIAAVLGCPLPPFTNR
jgi:Zn-dependent protease with chaperone function